MNIVFAFADDWGRYASAYADIEGENSINHLISTPNIDRIANEGVMFKNAYVPAPSCTPCRSAVLSGRYFWQTGLGAILVGAQWDDSIESYPLILEENGYHIGHTYKVWSPGVVSDAPYGGLRTAYNSGSRFGNFSHEATYSARSMDVESAKAELYEETSDSFKAFLDARPEGKPFCYWWGPTNTHRTWEKGSGKKLWGLNPDDLKGKLPSSLPDVHDIREDFCDYLGETLAFDAGLGVLIEHLEEIGEFDNTLFVVSGDHGIPGMPRGKCNLYNLGCEVALTARWPGRIKPGRVVDDLINIQDLAPTFLDAAGVDIPETMSASSLLPILEDEESGQIEDWRDYVVTGRERHFPSAREGNLPYPQRAIHTKDFLYIINFEPGRWPAGDPRGLEDPNYQIPYSVLEKKSSAAYSDIDASATKAWMIHHRNDDAHKAAFELGFGKRPGEELYDIRNDKDNMNNLVYSAEYNEIKNSLRQKLMEVLIKEKDPRVVESDCRFEHEPYAGPVKVPTASRGIAVFYGS